MPQIETVPQDFPWEPWPVSIGGAAPEHRGQQERRERYCICLDVVEQLVVHCHRKLEASPGLKPPRLLLQVNAALLIEAPDLSLLEQNWCLTKVKEQL